MLPMGGNGSLFFNYDFLDQSQNWSGWGQAPAEANEDREIRTNFVTVGAHYVVSRDFSLMVEVPYWSRRFKTDVSQTSYSGVGDVRLKGVYSGFFADMSAGLTLGVKLPTGEYTNPNADRDTQIGTGSTDVLLGGYLRNSLSGDGTWTAFETAQWQQPVFASGEYMPGAEINASAGVYYSGISFGDLKVTPLLQTIATYRFSDGGAESNPDDSGYKRLLISPGVEMGLENWMIYGDVGVPVFQNMKGNQLAAPVYLKLAAGYRF
jgi:hypothetical protein